MPLGGDKWETAKANRELFRFVFSGLMISVLLLIIRVQFSLPSLTSEDEVIQKALSLGITFAVILLHDPVPAMVSEHLWSSTCQETTVFGDLNVTSYKTDELRQDCHFIW